MLQIFLLLSAIVSSFSELFPQYYLSWFNPRCYPWCHNPRCYPWYHNPWCHNPMSKKLIKNYNKYESYRFLAVLIVWSHIIYVLYNISPSITIIMTVILLNAFYYRSANLYLIAFMLIFYISYRKVDNKYLLFFSLLSILIGGSTIGIGRKGELYIDIIGRIVFSIGFFMFIYILVNLKKLKSWI